MGGVVFDMVCMGWCLRVYVRGCAGGYMYGMVVEGVWVVWSLTGSAWGGAGG